MLLTVGQVALTIGCALALCIYVGWGATWLGLPKPLRQLGPLFAPLVGYAIALWVGYMGVSTALNLRWSLAVLLLLATGLHILAWRRRWHPPPPPARTER